MHLTCQPLPFVYLFFYPDPEKGSALFGGKGGIEPWRIKSDDHSHFPPMEAPQRIFMSFPVRAAARDNGRGPAPRRQYPGPRGMSWQRFLHPASNRRKLQAASKHVGVRRFA